MWRLFALDLVAVGFCAKEVKESYLARRTLVPGGGSDDDTESVAGSTSSLQQHRVRSFARELSRNGA